MKTISIYVAEPTYAEFKSLSSRTGRPVAEHIRQAMEEYLQREQREQRSILDLAPHASGGMLQVEGEEALS
jgi:predicted transcriptional regulator